MDDPIFQDENGTWNFWDETWASFYGPFETQEDAYDALMQYVAELNGDG